MKSWGKGPFRLIYAPVLGLVFLTVACGGAANSATVSIPDSAKAVIQQAVDARLRDYLATHGNVPGSSAADASDTTIDYTAATTNVQGMEVHVVERSTVRPSGTAGSTAPASVAKFPELITLSGSSAKWQVVSMEVEGKCGLPPGWAHYPGHAVGQAVSPDPSASPGSC